MVFADGHPVHGFDLSFINLGLDARSCVGAPLPSLGPESKIQLHRVHQGKHPSITYYAVVPFHMSTD